MGGNEGRGGKGWIWFFSVREGRVSFASGLCYTVRAGAFSLRPPFGRKLMIRGFCYNLTSRLVVRLVLSIIINRYLYNLISCMCHLSLDHEQAGPATIFCRRIEALKREHTNGSCGLKRQWT